MARRLDRAGCWEGERTMASILHLSDLHLGTAADEEFGDHKVEVVRHADRQRRSSTLRTTLRALATQLRATGEHLDAVVVSGDITYQGSAEGFALLEEVLQELGDRLPLPSRTVVVPGNHDVAWYTEPGDPERYTEFVKGVRAKGYVTPNLEGIDLGPNSTVRTENRPVLIADDETFAIVALNSSDNCGVQVENGEIGPEIAEIEARPDDPAARRILDALRRASCYDVARIGDGQREAAGTALAGALDAVATEPLRVAVLHHQILPISLEEEVKPFESIVNLAQVRDWLALNKIDLVLHGHKHVARVYEDWYVPIGAGSGPVPPRKVVVSTVGTVGLGQPATNCVARLIRVDPNRAALGRFEVIDIPGVQPGTPIDLESLPNSTFTSRTGSRDSMVIRGADSQQVHEQLLDLTASGKLSGQPIICHVASPAGAHEMPASYSGLSDVPSDTEWFTDLVDLWQRNPRLSTMNFNHGERIFAMHGMDQMQLAIAALESKETSSRAIISLLDRVSDRIETNTEFPAFCTVQFVLLGRYLQVLAYFRKQEMRYWWPINLAELARLQEFAVSELNRSRGNSPVEPGPITTITAVPTAGSTVPRVAIPVLDRWVDDAPHRLVRMAVVVLNPEIATAVAAVEDWKSLVEQCRPKTGRAADGDPMPVAGLTRLHQELANLNRIWGPSDLGRHADELLDRACRLSEQFASRSRMGGIGSQQVADMQDLHVRLSVLVESIERAVLGTTGSSVDGNDPR